MSKRGLPTGLQMRHDAHYVDELAQQRPTPVGRLINLDKIDPNPEQPRVDIGDLADLTASIKEKGVLEPLLVKPSAINGRWMIIAGERRWRAAREAELRDVPCIEMDVDERAVAEIALIENMQRKDLTAWEEADGLRYLCERFGYTHEDISHKVGKSRSSVTEALSISAIPEFIRQRCRRADINSKSLILQIVRQPDEQSMLKMAESIALHGMTREDARASRRATTGAAATVQKASPYTYRYVSPEKDFKLELRFKKTKIQKDLIVAALKKAIENLNGIE